MTRTHLRRLAVAAILAMAAPLAASIPLSALAAAAAQPAGVTVKIDNFTFGPQVITVARGTTVTWLNDDDTPHVVAATDGISFRSRALDTGDRFAFTFAKPGEYPYYCTLHPHMTGKVIVKGG